MFCSKYVHLRFCRPYTLLFLLPISDIQYGENQTGFKTDGWVLVLLLCGIGTGDMYRRYLNWKGLCTNVSFTNDNSYYLSRYVLGMVTLGNLMGKMVKGKITPESKVSDSIYGQFKKVSLLFHTLIINFC